jgi:hypothetical protein
VSNAGVLTLPEAVDYEVATLRQLTAGDASGRKEWNVVYTSMISVQTRHQYGSAQCREEVPVATAVKQSVVSRASLGAHFERLCVWYWLKATEGDCRCS